MADLDTAFQAKYDVDRGSPYWYVRPRRVIAWNGGALDTTTGWVFTTGADASAAEVRRAGKPDLASDATTQRIVRVRIADQKDCPVGFPAALGTP
ncbi:hypothetical protein ACIBL3_34030 [Kribbella sp. NPDC050124]|uniref:hypothetical protein n=1 Tax=Kribbella sp. NPDC050124 TaxID=3364114 RepID=UPI00378BAB0C